MRKLRLQKLGFIATGLMLIAIETVLIAFEQRRLASLFLVLTVGAMVVALMWAAYLSAERTAVLKLISHARTRAALQAERKRKASIALTEIQPGHAPLDRQLICQLHAFDKAKLMQRLEAIEYKLKRDLFYTISAKIEVQNIHREINVAKKAVESLFEAIKP